MAFFETVNSANFLFWNKFKQKKFLGLYWQVTTHWFTYRTKEISFCVTQGERAKCSLKIYLKLWNCAKKLFVTHFAAVANQKTNKDKSRPFKTAKD